MRLNAKTKRKGRKDVRAIKDALKKSIRFEKLRKQVRTITYKQPLPRVAVVVPYVAPDPKQNPGYAARTDEQILQAVVDRFTSINMEAKAAEAKKYTQYGKRGKRTSIVIVDSGVNNNLCHKNLAAALPLMKSAPAMRPMYSSHLRNTPFNLRGKLIRPLRVYVEKGKKVNGEYIKGKVIQQNKAKKGNPTHLVYPQ